MKCDTRGSNLAAYYILTATLLQMNEVRGEIEIVAWRNLSGLRRPDRFETRPTLRRLCAYSTITQSLLLRPKTSGEYISSALAGGATKVPGVVARAT